jgi:hypothetical protein
MQLLVAGERARADPRAVDDDGSFAMKGVEIFDGPILDRDAQREEAGLQPAQEQRHPHDGDPEDMAAAESGRPAPRAWRGGRRRPAGRHQGSSRTSSPSSSIPSRNTTPVDGSSARSRKTSSVRRHQASPRSGPPPRNGNHTAPATSEVVPGVRSRASTRTRRPASASLTAVVSPITPRAHDDHPVLGSPVLDESLLRACSTS